VGDVQDEILLDPLDLPLLGQVMKSHDPQGLSGKVSDGRQIEAFMDRRLTLDRHPPLLGLP
jgi:hypothetical protein